MNHHISKKQLREFGILLGICFPLLLGFVIPLVTGHQFRLWSLWLGFPFLILGVIKPRLLLYPYKSWMHLGNYLGWINSRIILGIVFLLVLIPISLVMKLTGYDPLKIKKVNQNSYRIKKMNYSIDLTRIF